VRVVTVAAGVAQGDDLRRAIEHPVVVHVAIAHHVAAALDADQVSVAREADLPQPLLPEGHGARAESRSDIVLVCRQRHAAARVGTIGVEAGARLLGTGCRVDRRRRRFIIVGTTAHDAGGNAGRDQTTAENKPRTVFEVRHVVRASNESASVIKRAVRGSNTGNSRMSLSHAPVEARPRAPACQPAALQNPAARGKRVWPGCERSRGAKRRAAKKVTHARLNRAAGPDKSCFPGCHSRQFRDRLAPIQSEEPFVHE
jgi:hypothetical protein